MCHLRQVLVHNFRPLALLKCASITTYGRVCRLKSWKNTQKIEFLHRGVYLRMFSQELMLFSTTCIWVVFVIRFFLRVFTSSPNVITLYTPYQRWLFGDAMLTESSWNGYLTHIIQKSSLLWSRFTCWFVGLSWSLKSTVARVPFFNMNYIIVHLSDVYKLFLLGDLL